MNPIYRRVLLAVFVTIFLVTAPLVLLWTAGYRYNPGRARVEKTGIIKLDSKPRGAVVTVSGESQPETTPTSIFRLLPGEYDVRLNLKGYLPWRKVIRVNAAETTIPGRVTLVRDSISSLEQSAYAESGSFSDGGGQAAFIRKSGSLFEIVTNDLGNGTTQILGRETNAPCVSCRFVWSPNERRLALWQPAAANSPAYLKVFDRDRQESSAVKIATSTTTISWTSDGNRLVMIAPHKLTVRDDDGRVTQFPAPLGLEDFVTSNRGGLALVNRFPGVALERWQLDSADTRVTISILPPGDWRFITSSGRTILLTERMTERVFTFDFYSNRLGNEYAGTHAAWEHPDGSGRLLFWNDFEAYVTSDDGVRLLTRIGTPILDATWHPDGNLVILVTSNHLLALEIDDRDGRNTYELAKVDRSGDVNLSADGTALRFFGIIGNANGLFERRM